MIKKISLKDIKGISETLFIPLRGRYLESKRSDAITNDPKSIEIVDLLAHDFEAIDLPWDGQMMISARTEILDNATNAFMKIYPHALIVNLGCGLDTRFSRLDNGRILWFDLDLPECITLREKFFTQSKRCKFISKSVLDFSWLDDLPKDRKTLFIAEGLFMYFTESQVKSIIENIRENFHNSEILLEAHSPLLKRSWHKNKRIKQAYSHFKWLIHTGRSMEKWDTRITFVCQWCYLDCHPKRWRHLRFLRFIPLVKNAMKIVHLKLAG